MMMFVAGSVSTRVSIEKDVEEVMRNIGEGMSCVLWVWRESFVGTWGRGGGRSGERGGRGGDFSAEDGSGTSGP
jgi:hypothetical protein